MRLLSLALLGTVFALPILGENPPIRITEFAAGGHQSFTDEEGDTPDWLEIQNNSRHAIDLDGWTLSRGSHPRDAWRFPATNLPPGAFLVVFASGKDRRVTGNPLHSDFKLSHDGGTLILRGPNGALSKIEKYPQQISGVSFGLAPPAMETYAYLLTPTPGRSNSAAISTGPRIESVAHRPWPQEPAPDEPIIVTAKVSPVSRPLGEVLLHYRAGQTSETTSPMFDDGNHGDGVASDGIFGATIPARTAKPGQLIRYYVSAKDDAGEVSRWPLFATRKRYSASLGTVIADSSVRTRLPLIHLFPANARSRSSGGGDAMTLFYEGELYDNVDFSVHGQFSRMFPKSSYNLHFPYDHHFRYRTNATRVSDLKLMANYADKSKIRNTLAYEMIAATGSIGHFAFPVRVQKNGKFFSVAEVLENGDDRWLKRVGRDGGGALYKMNDALSGSPDNAEKKTRKNEGARDLASLAAETSERRPLIQRSVYAFDHIDIPQCISYFVALALISSGDHGHKNYYLYHDTRESGEWALLPWDVDLSWGRNWMGEYFNENLYVDNPLNLYRADHDKARNRLYNLFFDSPDFRQMYLRRLRTVMDQLLQAPNTPPNNLIIERRIRGLMDLLDPLEFKPSDAALDEAAWPQWGDHTSMRQEAQRIIDEYLPGRRNFLFKSSRAKLGGDPIPPSQSPSVMLHFLDLDSKLPLGQQFVCITNENSFAVDITGWSLSGAGIEHRFRPGTVIPVRKAIYAAANVKSFRHRSTPPTAGQSVFVQGNWRGELRGGGEPLRLTDAQGRSVAQHAVP